MHLEQALVFAREEGDKRLEGAVLSNLAATYFLQGSLDKASECLEMALPVVRAGGDRDAVANVLNTLGVACRD